ncbi:MAG: glycosyltransferase 87 family protein [Isosphaeraceae bacterium]
MAALLIKILYVPTLLVIGLGAMLLILGRKIPRRWARVLALLGLAGAAVRLSLVSWTRVELALDFSVFWKVGAAFWNGQDPYQFAFDPPFLYPPNAPPLFALLALLPEWTSDSVLTVINIALALSLAPLSVLALRGRMGTDGVRLSSWEILILGNTVAFSPSTTLCVLLGQLPLIVTGFLLLALAAQSHAQPILAGIGLAVAAVKPTTTMPFLLLFHRWADARSWIALVVLTLGLCLLTGRPTDWPHQLQSVMKTIRQSTEPGGPNDYTFANTRNAHTRIGLDHTLYRLGLRDQRRIGVIAGAIIAAVGGWLVWEMFFNRVIPRDGMLCLVALYAMLFFYHRIYDSVLLALPFVYSANRTRVATGAARLGYGVTALACLAVLYTPSRLLESGLLNSLEWGGVRGWAFQALVTPWATWWVVIGFVFLVLAERLGRDAQCRDVALAPVASGS